MKSFNQQSDPVQGSDLCHRIFGDNANKRHKQFKAFFCLQDPVKQAPARKDRPTYKVDSFLKHLQMVSMSAWRLGRDISGDEQTIGFQGHHSDKLRITYRRRETVSNAMHWQTQDSPGPFTSATNQRQKSGQSLGILHCIPKFWECLTNLRRNTTIVGSITCTCLQSLQGQHTST